MLAEFTTWLLNLIKAALSALLDIALDAFVKVLDLVLSAVVALFALLPVPDALAGGLQSLWSTLDGGIMYMANQVGIPQAFAIIGAAYVFRLARKVVTLFQW